HTAGSGVPAAVKCAPIAPRRRAAHRRTHRVLPRRISVPNQSESKAVVLLAEVLPPATTEAPGPDFDVRTVGGTDRDALFAALVDADAVLVRSATRIDAEALSHAPKLKVVARAGVGLDNVDIKAATTAGVMVVNAPTSNIVSAAELTIGH